MTTKSKSKPLSAPVASPERVLAIDASTEATGYALIHSGNLLWSTEDNTHKYHGDVTKILRNYFVTLKGILLEHNPDVIIFEDVALFATSHMGTVISLARLSAIPYLVSKDIPVYKVNVNSWKARVIGRGSSPKSASVQWVKTRYGLDMKDNESDAVCIGQMWELGRDKLK